MTSHHDHSKLPFRARLDLEFNASSGEGDQPEQIVVKDPLSQKYFQLTPNAFFILQCLNEPCTLDEIRSRYHKAFLPSRIELRRLEKLVYQFFRDGLVYSTAGEQGSRLFEQHQNKLNAERLGKLSNVLAIRFRGFDPDRLLTVMNRCMGWIFSRYAVVTVMVVALIVFAITISRLPILAEQLPRLNSFFQFGNLVTFVVVFALCKVFHEFGHGIACKRFGGECHEIGFMLLVMTPCLYCNVSDSWRLKNKWQRIAIGSAGMYVEIILATIAAIVWMNVSDGWIQMVALQVMLLCSISTIVFNGNPLLRFDGYYILSDILEIPNLMQRSNEAFRKTLTRSIFGLENSSSYDLPCKHRLLFAIYSLLSSVYRWLIIASILWFLCNWLEPMGLKSLGVVIAILSVGGMAISPVARAIKFFRVPGQWQRFKPVRTAGVLGLVATLLSGVLFIPLPHFVHFDVVMLPEKMQTVFVLHPGILEEVVVKPGQQVKQGDLIARTRNDDLLLKKLDFESELHQAKTIRKLLTSSGSGQEWQPDQVAATDARIRQLAQTVSSLDEQIGSQEFVAAISGRIVAVHNSHTPFAEFGNQRKLDFQSNTILDEQNLGTYVERGTCICEVVDEVNWNAVVLVDAVQFDFVQFGQATSIRLKSDPYSVLEANITAIGPSDQLLSASGLQGAAEYSETSGPTMVETLVAGRNRDAITYLALARVESPEVRMRVGSSGRARIYCGQASLGWRLSRYLLSHFR